jgi:diguanylate cyclase (GGDEF)-like protein
VRRMALLDPRLIEIDILSEADRRSFSGGMAYEHRRSGTRSQEDRQREEALLDLVADHSLLAAGSYGIRPSVDQAIVELANQAAFELLDGARSIIYLKITHRGRLRLFRLRDEILSGRDRIRDQFGVLWDHRHWLPDLAVHLRKREPGQPVSLLLVDVDHLKALNKELGNPGADKVLTGIFEELRDVVRPHEGYRLGGDEAGAILVGVPLMAAKTFGEEVRKRVRARAWPPSLGLKAPPTVSVGVGTLTRDMDAEAFYAAVDVIRGRAKVNRNEVIAAAVPELAG